MAKNNKILWIIGIILLVIYLTQPPEKEVMKKKASISDFSKCKAVTISNAGSTLTNYPAYIRILYDNDMQPTFTDLMFMDNPTCGEDGTELAYEIDNYAGGDYAGIWVRIPSLLTPSTTISMYYGNLDPISRENPTGVWDSSYKMVHHFAETSGNYYLD
ncbi:unnamed protein product [marine sediment metagenome]|uniref:DUF2341 domain-containing protein n=1 Tax=marine sediment metagenome TaxID=412755 RepID=X1QZD3_9ZZZZ